MAKEGNNEIDCHIGVEGTRRVCEILKTNLSLMSLDLSGDNGIKENKIKMKEQLSDIFHKNRQSAWSQWSNIAC